MNNAPIFECSVAICDLQPTEEALYVPDCIRSGNVQSRLASYIIHTEISLLTLL